MLFLFGPNQGATTATILPVQGFPKLFSVNIPVSCVPERVPESKNCGILFYKWPQIRLLGIQQQKQEFEYPEVNCKVEWKHLNLERIRDLKEDASKVEHAVIFHRSTVVCFGQKLQRVFHLDPIRNPKSEIFYFEGNWVQLTAGKGYLMLLTTSHLYLWVIHELNPKTYLFRAR